MPLAFAIFIFLAWLFVIYKRLHHYRATAMKALAEGAWDKDEHLARYHGRLDKFPDKLMAKLLSYRPLDPA